MENNKPKKSRKLIILRKRETKMEMMEIIIMEEMITIMEEIVILVEIIIITMAVIQQIIRALVQVYKKNRLLMTVKINKDIIPMRVVAIRHLNLNQTSNCLLRKQWILRHRIICQINKINQIKKNFFQWKMLMLRLDKL